MPLIIIVLTIGLVLGLLLRQWFRTATPEEIKTFKRLTLWTVAIGGLLILILTGRFFHALGWSFMVLLALLISGTIAKQRQSKRITGYDRAQPLTIQQAYDLLGLQDGATKKEVQAAYIALIQTLQPDHDGSQERSAQLNEAYDILMDPERWQTPPS